VAAAFDPTGERVVTATAASKDNARIWDARTGEPIGKPLQHADKVVAAAFNSTGEHVVTASYDQTARIWRAPPTAEALVVEILAVLGPRAPAPLKVPESASQHEGYAALMEMGVQTLWARAKSLF
jgi:WD40 repeat protein